MSEIDPNLRTAYSREELADALRAWMLDIWGNPRELDEEAKDKWYTYNGLIYAFIHDHFPVAEAAEKTTLPDPLLAEIRQRLHELPEVVLANEKKNPAWSEAEIWGIERDILPSLRLLCWNISALLPETSP